MTRLRIGISSCLLGDEVRFDGGHKRDAALIAALGPYVEWVRVCPEVELGLGVPRPTLRLERRRGEIHLLEPASGRDLGAWSREWLETAGVNVLRPELVVDGDTYRSVAVLQEAPADYPTLRSHRIIVSPRTRSSVITCWKRGGTSVHPTKFRKQRVAFGVAVRTISANSRSTSCGAIHSQILEIANPVTLPSGRPPR